MDDVIDVGRGLMRRTPSDVVLMPVMDVRKAQERMEELQVFCANYLQESKDGGTDGGDYGIIPGASGKKRVLFKSGADKLCDVYGLADRYLILGRVEDFERGLFDYTIECHLVRKTDEMFVGSGLGACSTWESKYRWRDSQRTCPACNTAAIIKGKAEFGGGWLCWARKGGCGAKFADNDPAITDQKAGRVENPDIIDTKNTVLKMAKKRAKIDAVIGVTRSSGIFTQDLEEHELAESKTPATTAPAQDQPTPPSDETHEQKIARIKAEAAAKQKAATSTGPHPADSDAVHTTSGVEPTPAAMAAAIKGKDHVPVEAPAPGDAAPEGCAFITAINVRNGPMVMKDGKSQPSWGPLYIIAFSQKIRASDGTLVSDASTFTQEDAAKAEAAREAGVPLKPVIEPGSKKGSFRLIRFDAM
jgi:hypothetical protein